MTPNEKLQKVLSDTFVEIQNIIDECEDEDLQDELFWEGYKNFCKGSRLMRRRLANLENNRLNAQ